MADPATAPRATRGRAWATGAPRVAALTAEELLTVWARPLPTEQTTTRVIDGRVQDLAGE